MKHVASEADLQFQRAFEAGEVPASEFDHRAHVRLAYVFLCTRSTEAAHEAMRAAILGFLRHLGADLSKYHETITRAWIMAVCHFMEQSPACDSAAAFIDRNPVLLDPKIMLTHYSAEVLFSAQARSRFVEPDVQDIPRHS